MQLHLHKLTISLESDQPLLRRHWRRLFAGWLAQAPQRRHSDLCLQLTLADTLPPLPETAPYFTDAQSKNAGILSVYRTAVNEALLHYQDGALVRVPLDAPVAAQSVIRGVATEQVLQHGRFEDVTFTSLAPVLRRHGYFLVHAFAAGKNGRCVLIVGPTGSGKTTTGLSLLLRGWQLLANDVVLLEARPDGIYALPTPGDVGIRPHTFELLPALRALAKTVAAPGPVTVPAQQLIDGRWSPPQRVTAVVTPRIEGGDGSRLAPQPRAICLSRLMEESIDRWDEATLLDHIDVLEAVTTQATPYTLHLGRDLEQAAALLEQA